MAAIKPQKKSVGFVLRPQPGRKILTIAFTPDQSYDIFYYERKLAMRGWGHKTAIPDSESWIVWFIGERSLLNCGWVAGDLFHEFCDCAVVPKCPKHIRGWYLGYKFNAIYKPWPEWRGEES